MHGEGGGGGGAFVALLFVWVVVAKIPLDAQSENKYRACICQRNVQELRFIRNSD